MWYWREKGLTKLKAKKKTKTKNECHLRGKKNPKFECSYTSIKLSNANKQDINQVTNWEKIFIASNKRLIFLIHKKPL